MPKTKPKKEKEAPRLYVDSIDAQSRAFDFYTHAKTQADSDQPWWWECRRCEECGAIASADSVSIFFQHPQHNEGDDECAACADHDCKIARCKYRDQDDAHAEGPMMNYFWPCKAATDASALLLVDLPLIPVEIDGESGFALTGGGQDLSWEIAAAYVAVGHYPPAAIEVPADCRRLDGESGKRWLAVADALYRSYSILASWCQGRVHRLDRELESLRAYTRKRRAEDKARKDREVRS